MTVRAGKSAKVRALAWPSACDEERHIRLLSMGGNSAKQHHARCQQCANSNDSHEIPPDVGGDPTTRHREANTMRDGAFLRSRGLDDASV
jgi:hypothetical protein